MTTTPMSLSTALDRCYQILAATLLPDVVDPRPRLLEPSAQTS